MSKPLWIIETSHIINPPPFYRADNVEELLSQVQQTADTHEGKSSDFGKLAFKIELDDMKRPFLVRASFTGKDSNPRRFMRLRRNYA